MDKKTQSFGDYIKEKRTTHDPKFTLKRMAEALGLNLTYLSDVENNRKKPFAADKIEMFCKLLKLSDEERSEMYDLAARDSDSVSQDIIDTIMYTETGDYARKALRMVKKGKGDVELWKELIRKMEESNGSL